MATEIIMPQLGLTMTEGTVTKWFKQVGDTVAPGEVIAEISTDKISNQLEATAGGTLLAIMVPAGSVAPVKAPIAIIGQPGEKVVSAAAEPAAAAPATTNAAASAPAAAVAPTTAADGWVKASPLARRLAKEQGIDLAKVTATGPDGLVVERDVLAAADAVGVKASPLAAKVAADHGFDLGSIAKDGRIMKDDVVAALPKAALPAAGQPLTGMRKVIAERMSLSWQTAPHVCLTVETDMTEAKKLKDQLSRSTGGKVSYTEIIVKCAAQALRELPMVNNSLIDGKLVVNPAINIGVAVALDGGLIVPVIRQADQKSIRQLNKEIADLGGKAREGRLGPDEYTGGTFTVTNLGMYGVDHFNPVINPPESAIIGVCRLVDRPVVVDGAVVVRPLMNLCLSFDHRLIDGALAAQFMARVRQLIEQPLLLL